MDAQRLKTVIFVIKNSVNETLTYFKEEQEELDFLVQQLRCCDLNAIRIDIQEAFDEYEFSEVETLIVTDCGVRAKKYVEKGYPVIGYLHMNNANEKFSKVTYIVEGFAELDANYFINIFKRFKKIPWDILETNRCRIREITVDDINALYEIYKEPSITYFMENLFEDPEKEKEYVLNYIACIYGFYGYGMWIVELKNTGEIIGRAGLEQNDDAEGLELGYMISVPYQRKGYGKEVCAAILHYGKNQLGATVIGTMIEEKNKASEALCSSLGFQFQKKVIKNKVNYKKYIWSSEHT